MVLSAGLKHKPALKNNAVIFSRCLKPKLIVQKKDKVFAQTPLCPFFILLRINSFTTNNTKSLTDCAVKTFAVLRVRASI